MATDTGLRTRRPLPTATLAMTVILATPPLALTLWQHSQVGALRGEKAGLVDRLAKAQARDRDDARRLRDASAELAAASAEAAARRREAEDVAGRLNAARAELAKGRGDLSRANQARDAAMAAAAVRERELRRQAEQMAAELRDREARLKDAEFKIEVAKAYAILNVETHKALDIAGGCTNECNVQMYEWHAGGNQMVHLIPAGGGFFKIQLHHSGLLLTLLADHRRLVQAADNGSDLQLWEFVPAQGSGFFIRSKCGVVLDIEDANRNDHSVLQGHPLHGGWNQIFEKVSLF